MFSSNLFTEEDLSKLDQAVFDILENVGLMYQSDRILQALKKAGAKVDQTTQVAKLPREFVQEIIEDQKREPSKSQRETQPFAQGDYKVGIGLAVAHFYYDYDKKQRRPGNRDDLITLIHFGDALDPDLSVSQALNMMEVHPMVENLEGLLLLLEHTNRPGYVYPYYAEQMPYLAEIGQIYAKDWKRFIIGGIFMVSPLRMDKRAADFMVKKLEYGLECSVGTQPISGGNAPVTMAGTIALGAAEILGGWAASKAINPEAPLYGSICSGVMDMRTGKASFCSPEAMLMDIGCVELFRRLYGGHVGIAGGPDYTDAKLPGLQAAFEKTFEAMAIAAFTGTYFHMGDGLLDSGRMISPVQLILDKELGEFLWKFSKGIQVNEETLALDVIKDVGIGITKNYFDHEHTFRHFRRALWHPQILDRTCWQHDAKEHEKEKQVLEKANDKFKQILGQYKPPEVNEDMLNRVREVVKKAKKELIK